MEQYSQRSGNATLSLRFGECHFYAWSQSANLLDCFGLSQTQTGWEGRLRRFLYLYASVFIPIGALLIALAASILTHQVWR